MSPFIEPKSRQNFCFRNTYAPVQIPIHMRNSAVNRIYQEPARKLGLHRLTTLLLAFCDFGPVALNPDFK